MATLVEVSSYLVFSYASPAGFSGAGGADALISLTTVNPNLLPSLRFYRAGSVIPPNSFSSAGGRTFFYCNYTYDQLPVVIDLLRNEKPIRFFFRDDNLLGYITTAVEPVGEGEN